MSMLEELKDLGVDVDQAVKRLNGNESFYQRMLKSFPAMVQSAPVLPDFDASDYQGVMETAHALKGATGNLSLTPLYDGYTKIVALLREDKPEEARKVLTDVLPVQEQIIDVINKDK